MTLRIALVLALGLGSTGVLAQQPTAPRPAAPPPAAPVVDLAKLRIPILAVNGSFDNPYRKTHRLWREAQIFQNVILKDKTHLTAIAAGAPPSQEYIDAIAKFINAYDVK